MELTERTVPIFILHKNWIKSDYRADKLPDLDTIGVRILQCNALFPMIAALSFVKKKSMHVETAPVKEPMPFCVTLCRDIRVYRFLRGRFFHRASESRITAMMTSLLWSCGRTVFPERFSATRHRTKHWEQKWTESTQPNRRARLKNELDMKRLRSHSAQNGTIIRGTQSHLINSLPDLT